MPDSDDQMAQSGVENKVNASSHSLTETAMKIANRAGIDLSSELESALKSVSEAKNRAKSESKSEASADLDCESDAASSSDLQ